MEAAAHPWPALGALLMRDGTLTVEQLEQALRDKETSGKRLGEILVDRGYVTPTQISRVLAETSPRGAHRGRGQSQKGAAACAAQ